MNSASSVTPLKEEKHVNTTVDSELSETHRIQRGRLLVWISQLWIMLKRNTLLQFRHWRTSVSQSIGSPIVFMLILFLLQQTDYANQRITDLTPSSQPLDGVRACDGPNPCINLIYTPDSPQIRSVLKLYASKNAARTGQKEWEFFEQLKSVDSVPSKTIGMVPVASSDFLYRYVLSNPNVTNWGIVFHEEDDPVTNFQYQIWYNASRISNGVDVFGSQILSFMRGMDEAIISAMNSGKSANININMKDWPVVPPAEVSDKIVQQLGPVFFFCCVMVIFINVLSQILQEKELKLRHGMEVMGLKPSVYWLSQFLSNSILVFIGSLTTVILGLIFGFQMFRKSSFFALFFTFFLYGESMIIFAFFLSTFFKKTQAGVFVGIFIFIIGLLFESFVFSSGYIGYIWWKPTTSTVFPGLLSLLPFFNFGKLFLDISSLTTGQLDYVTNRYQPGPGLSWESLYQTLPAEYLPSYTDSTVANPPAPCYSFYWLVFDMAFYSILTWYFDNVIPNEYGKREPLYFFLKPSYWGYHGFNTKQSEQYGWLKSNVMNPPVTPPNIDPDVLEEQMLALSPDIWPAVKVVHLRKEYRTVAGKISKIAVKDTCINFENGKLVGLLGQNGAGKSTTLNILSGLMPPTSGDAYVFGYSLRYQMHQIREIMGVCPQHDILFGELTAREHIELYAGLKGVPKNEWDIIINERLHAVRLLKVADNPVRTFSGGMKRRLSVVISTIGDPKIIYLDEPTTGMDPVNRRHVWKFIEKFKKNRVIVLTTHSMEEADVLSDRLAIMVHGRIRAIGDPISLKSKFGSGYKISIICEPYQQQVTKDFIKSNMPTAILEDDAAGALLYNFPLNGLSSVTSLVKKLNGDKMIKNWGLSQTTLEQVFLSIVRKNTGEGLSNEF
ncbi:hypothetical protein BC833DRAFT_583272 [Globomyces pollinis-pini]|nr:hypothetical protein BC833DRAFT_583272 [Globomyces pollinis-pini]